jgi:P2 family phage contractile tail tube protein
MAKYQTRTIKGSLYDRTDGTAKKLHDTTAITLPDLELLTETIKGAGINGEIDLPTLGQLPSIVIEVSHNGLSRDTIKTFRMRQQHLEHRWAGQTLNSTTGAVEVVGKKVIFKGIPKKLGLGSIEPNKAEETSSSFEVTYLKYVIGNDVVLEIDKLNDVFIIDGEDYSAAIRDVI